MDNMEITDKWFFVIVRDPGTSDEEFVGFSDDKTQVKFLPVFKTKQDAKACFTKLPKDIFKAKYDVHAVIEEDILYAAKDKGHAVFVVDETGKILSQLK